MEERFTFISSAHWLAKRFSLRLEMKRNFSSSGKAVRQMLSLMVALVISASMSRFLDM